MSLWGPSVRTTGDLTEPFQACSVVSLADMTKLLRLAVIWEMSVHFS